MAGYPAFDRNGHVRVYCVSVDAEDILDLFVALGRAAGWGCGEVILDDLDDLDPAYTEMAFNAIEVGGKYWQWLERKLVSQSISIKYYVEGTVLTVGVRKYPLPDGAELVAPANAPCSADPTCGGLE